MNVKETPNHQTYAQIYIDQVLYISCKVEGLEHWATDNDGSMLYITKITISCIDSFDISCNIGKEIKLINSNPKKYFGYSAIISEIKRTSNSITFYLNAESFTILISDNISLG